MKCGLNDNSASTSTYKVLNANKDRTRSYCIVGILFSHSTLLPNEQPLQDMAETDRALSALCGHSKRQMQARPRASMVRRRFAPDERVDALGLDVIKARHCCLDLLLVGAHVSDEHLSIQPSKASRWCSFTLLHSVF